MESLAASATDAFDLTEPADQARLFELADALVGLADPAAVRRVAATAPLEFRLAAKLAQSRTFLLGLAEPVRVAVVFAMWGERSRLQPKSEGNPFGEDSLRTKVRQLGWATSGTPVEWQLYAVDDGCPDRSGDLAAEIAAELGSADQIRVLQLAQQLPAEVGPLRNLAGADDSRKGGSIVLGAQTALDDGIDLVAYTDADNSVHLGQLGLLLRPHLRDGVGAVFGDRRHPDSVLVKDAARWGIGIKNLRHMQRMAGAAIFGRGITDTQAAFKLYHRRVLEQILADPAVFDFSFDTDWIGAVVAAEEPYAQVPFAFIDSAAESATAKQLPMTTWEALLKGLVKALRRHQLLRTESSREMAAVIEDEIGSYRDLDAIIDSLPAELVDAGEAEYGDPEVMSAQAMRRWFREQKAAAGLLD